MRLCTARSTRAAGPSAGRLPDAARLPGEPTGRLAGQVAVRDDPQLDLGGALEDLRQPGVPPVALDREVRRVAGAAVDLEGLAGHALGHLARQVLDHRGLGVAR